VHAAVAAGNDYSISTCRRSRKNFIFNIANGCALDLFKLDAAVCQQATDGFGTVPGTSSACGRIDEKWYGALLYYGVAQSAGLQMLQCTPLVYKIT
jgi:hypothetical protein